MDRIVTPELAYRILAEERAKWKPGVAFYKAAERLGISPRELSTLFRGDKDKALISEGQGSLF